MKKRITTALAITLTALGLASLPSLASAENNQHRDGIFKSFPQHGGDRDRHYDRHSDNRRDHDRHGKQHYRHDDRRHYGKHHNHGHHYGYYQRHVHGPYCGHGPQHGYYRAPGHYGHGSHISGFYMDPHLGIKVVIH